MFDTCYTFYNLREKVNPSLEGEIEHSPEHPWMRLFHLLLTKFRIESKALFQTYPLFLYSSHSIHMGFF